jgi:hypothetical protein
MVNGLEVFVLIAAISLCAIVGIYYCWVRKLKKPE